MVTSLQNCLDKFCNLFSVNLENFPLKGNLKYQIFSLVLLGSISLGLFTIFLFKYLLTDLSINLGGYLLFCKMTFSFSRYKWKPSHVLFKRKVRSIKVLMKPFFYVNGTKLLSFCKSPVNVLFLQTLVIKHCKLPSDISYSVYCFLDFNKELVTWILDCKMVDSD